MLEAQPIVLASSILAGTLTVDIGQKWVLSRMVKKGTNWFRKVFLSALVGPLTLILWISGLSLSVEHLPIPLDERYLSFLPSIWSIGVIFGFAWFATRLIRRVETRVIETKKRDVTSVDAASKVLRIVVGISAFLMILSKFGFSLSGVLAFGGIGGIAIGFASQDMLSNFFGAFMIYWDRPFNVGDWVRSDEKEIEGIVEQIGWRSTRIRAFDKRLIYVPNSIFSKLSLVNVTKMTHRRIKESIGIRYDDISAVNSITTEIEEMLLKHPKIDTKQILIVSFEEFGPFSLNILIYCQCKEKRWKEFMMIKQEILLNIGQIIASNNAQIAYPTTRRVEDRYEEECISTT